MGEQIWTTKDLIKAVVYGLVIGFIVGIMAGYDIGHDDTSPMTFKPVIG